MSMLAFGGSAAIAGGALALFAPEIVRVVFGSDFEAAVPIMRIFGLVLPLNVVGVVLSAQWLLPRGRDRRVTGVLLVACVVNAAAVMLAAELSGLRAAAWAVVGVELLVVTGYGLGLRTGADPSDAGAQVVGQPQSEGDDRERGVGEAGCRED
jgi:PST family polysaccharide transporter